MARAHIQGTHVAARTQSISPTGGIEAMLDDTASNAYAVDRVQRYRGFESLSLQFPQPHCKGAPRSEGLSSMSRQGTSELGVRSGAPDTVGGRSSVGDSIAAHPSVQLTHLNRPRSEGGWRRSALRGVSAAPTHTALT